MSRAEKPRGAGGLGATVRELLLILVVVFAIHSVLAKPFYIPSGSMMPLLRSGDRLLVSKYPYGWSYASVSFHLAPVMPGRIWPRPPARGDIVVLEHPELRVDYIKRVVGLPGDRLAMAGGVLSINGVAVKRAVQPLLPIPADANLPDLGTSAVPVRTDAAGQRWLDVPIVRETLPGGASYDTIDLGPGYMIDDFAEILVPAGHYFLLGDHRDGSADSRVATAQQGLGGAVPFEAISGRAEFIAYSTDGSVRWFNPLTWISGLRAGRAGVSLRPKIEPEQ